LIRDLQVPGVPVETTQQLWWQLAAIISCGTLAAVLIPEFTKVFTSSHSKHVHEIVTASREGGTSLTILSGLVAGNFSAFWNGILIAGLMSGAYFVSREGLDDVMQVQLTPARSYTLENDESIDAATRTAIERELRESQREIEEAVAPAETAAEAGDQPEAAAAAAPPVEAIATSATLEALDPVLRDRIKLELTQTNLVGVGSIFAFGLVAFGFLCMGPVNIAVDSYGPVTDNAQSIFELAQTEQIPGVHEQIKRDFGFEPDFVQGKH
jgi:Na+/H+-translocating membrane pyrophosphatase